jgi:hypothetical protein
MPKPISRRELIRRFRTFGFEGPFPGSKHGTMRKGAASVAIPNPRKGDIDWSLTKRLLEQADIDAKQWESLG